MNQQNQKPADSGSETLEQVLRAKAEDDRIACEIALATAAEFGVSPSVVGQALNKLEIKIASCQLGCFP